MAYTTWTGGSHFTEPISTPSERTPTDCSPVPSRSTTAETLYRAQLTNITQRLGALNTTLLYITTTPFMPDASIGNLVVDDLNAIAREVAGPVVSEVVDLHKTVTDHCGLNYTDCDWCRRHPCSYHYNPEGETAQARVIADAIRRLL